jgi:predicted dehydrogenase
LVQQALAAGKHVFVEKPLCITADELTAIEASHTGQALLMVGFNRRFAPLLQDLQLQLTSLQGPKAFVYTCNAGAIPADHWTQDPASGGGRLIGEACHFVDLLRFLVGHPIQSYHRTALADPKPCPDTASLSLTFADGSIGTIHYLANGAKAFPKERLEVFCQGRILQLDNYRRLQGWGWPNFQRQTSWRQDKGQVACMQAFVAAIGQGQPTPIPFDELLEVHHWLLQSVS